MNEVGPLLPYDAWSFLPLNQPISGLADFPKLKGKKFNSASKDLTHVDYSLKQGKKNCVCFGTFI